MAAVATAKRGGSVGSSSSDAPAEERPVRASWAEQRSASDAFGARASQRRPLTAAIAEALVEWGADFLEDANDGDPQSMYVVGQMYHVGWGAFKQSDAEAKKWMQRAAAAGNIEAELYLANQFGAPMPSKERLALIEER